MSYTKSKHILSFLNYLPLSFYELINSYRMTSFFELTIVKKANLLEEYDCFTGRGVESLLSV